MKYRAKATHCMHLIENIYDQGTLFTCRDAKDVYVEVDTEEEAAEIDGINIYCKMIEIHYSRLVELMNKKH